LYATALDGPQQYYSLPFQKDCGFDDSLADFMNENRKVWDRMDQMGEELSNGGFRVAIFGSARLTDESPEYRLVFNLVRLIASAEMNLVTGGGPGLMAAATDGFYEGKKDTSINAIGLNIKLPKEQTFAAHLDIKRQFDRFSERLDSFVALSNAFVVTPGGIGTILELFYVWQLAQVKEIANKPLILMGEMWTDLLRWMREWPLGNNLLDESDLHLIYLTKDYKEAFAVIQESYNHFKKGGTEFCRTYQGYRP
jgi:uncharacterized protein (TIGR00730 family)